MSSEENKDLPFDLLSAISESVVQGSSPPVELIAAPVKESIWQSMQTDTARVVNAAEKAKAVKSYTPSHYSEREATPKEVEAAQRTTPDSAAATSYYRPPASNTSNTQQKPASTGYSGYSWQGQTPRVKTPEEVIEEDFKEIRESAFKVAEREGIDNRVAVRRSNNPQLETLSSRKVHKTFREKAKDAFAPGSWGRKAALVAGAILAKSVATVLLEMRQGLRK